MKIERDDGGAGAPRRRAQESSVVFSLASLRAMVEADARPNVRAALPSFSGTELGGVPAASARAPVIAHVVPAPSNLPLMMMLGMLLLTTIALGAYVVMTPRQHVVITRVVTPAVDEVDRVVEPVLVAQPEPRVEAIAPIDPPPPEAPAVKPEPERRTTPRTRTRQHDQARTVDPLPVAQPERRGEVPLECVLDPSLPKCGGKTKTPPPSEPPKTAVDPNLPETLGNGDIRNGIAAVKGSAKMCGDKFGATDGEKVRVKLSIVGATGAVSSTAAEDPHRGTALGNCVAAALKKATFPHFRKSVIGVEYTITL